MSEWRRLIVWMVWSIRTRTELCPVTVPVCLFCLKSRSELDQLPSPVYRFPSKTTFCWQKLNPGRTFLSFFLDPLHGCQGIDLQLQMKPEACATHPPCDSNSWSWIVLSGVGLSRQPGSVSQSCWRLWEPPALSADTQRLCFISCSWRINSEIKVNISARQAAAFHHQETSEQLLLPLDRTREPDRPILEKHGK